jgi:tetratricopeptide (TPR) repeat protein
MSQETGDYKDAIKHYNKALEINPKNAYAFYNRAIAKEDSEDLEGAIQDCTDP